MGKLVMMQSTVNFIASKHPEKIEGFGNEWIPMGEKENGYYVQSEKE